MAACALPHASFAGPFVPAPLQLAVLNPNKCYALEYLLRKHASDKVIVFSESVVALQLLAKELQCPCIFGDTGAEERRFVIKYPCPLLPLPVVAACIVAVAMLAGPSARPAR